MPAPTCTCSVCGEIVPKSQTRHVGDGKRACKSHDGVNEQAQKAQESLERSRKATYKQANQRRKDRDARSWPVPFAQTGYKSCDTCGCEGVDSIEALPFFWTAWKTFPELRSTFAKDFRPILRLHKLPESILVRGLILDRIRARDRDRSKDSIIETMGVVWLCSRCARSFGIDPAVGMEVGPIEHLTFGAEVTAAIEAYCGLLRQQGEERNELPI